MRFRTWLDSRRGDSIGCTLSPTNGATRTTKAPSPTTERLARLRVAPPTTERLARLRVARLAGRTRTRRYRVYPDEQTAGKGVSHRCEAEETKVDDGDTTVRKKSKVGRQRRNFGHDQIPAPLIRFLDNASRMSTTYGRRRDRGDERLLTDALEH